MSFKLLLLTCFVSTISVANAGTYTLTSQDIECLKNGTNVTLYKSVGSTFNKTYNCIGDGSTYFLGINTTVLRSSLNLQILPGNLKAAVGKTIYTNKLCNPDYLNRDLNQVYNGNLNNLGINITVAPVITTAPKTTTMAPGQKCSNAFIWAMNNL